VPINLRSSLQLLDGFRATRSALRELQGDADFALWLELRPRLIADPLDGCLYLAADHVLVGACADDLRRALLGWVTGSRTLPLAALSTDAERYGLDVALASYVASGRWRPDVAGLAQLAPQVEPEVEVEAEEAVAADRALPRARAAARGGGRHALEQGLLLVALEHLRLEEDIAGQVRRSIEHGSTVPLIAWPLDLVR
jgi:hypothetical protein